jgi:hypothetical protein
MAVERDRLIAEGLDAMIVEERQAKVVAIGRASRRRQTRRTPTAGVARALHDDAGIVTSAALACPLTCSFLVVGRGVDPRTSRFSGARSTS